LIAAVRQVKTLGMGIGTNPDYADQFAAALAWWREAGVDCAFLDQPRDWMPAPDAEAESRPGAPVRRKPPTPAEPPPPPPVVVPDDLAAFQTWWMTAPELDGGRCLGRVAPRGSAAPALMILAPAPESTDTDTILSGAEGRMVDAFLKAAGLADDQVYRASALPCHSPGADWSPAANALLSQALLRHIQLVRPERLLVLGFVVLPLLGHDSPQGPAVSQHLNHEGASIPMLAVRRLPAPASQPRWKSALWHAWLDWSA
jgi:uracil-DNA glycosylase